MKHFSGWAFLSRCNEAALPYALPMSHRPLRVSEAGPLHLFMNCHWTSYGNKPCRLLLAFSAVAYTSRQYVRMQLLSFFLSFFWLRLHQYPEGVIISSLGCLGESWLAFHSRSWLVTGQSLAVLPSPLAPSRLWAHLLPGYARRLGNQSLSSPCGSDSFVPAGAVVSVPHNLSLQNPGRRLRLSVRWNRSKRILMGCVFRRF